MLFYSWRGEHDARIAAEAKIKADKQQVQVLQQNIAQNNQAIAQLQEQQNARDAAAAKQIATLSTLVSRHIYMTLNTDPENLSVAVVSEVGETAKRLDVSPDSVRNYCERGWLQFVRKRGNHRRVLLRSIEAFEAQRRPNKPDLSRLLEPPPQKRQVDEDLEIYYLGNELYPNELNRGYICNFSFFKDLFPRGFNPSTILREVGSLEAVLSRPYEWRVVGSHLP